MDLEFRKCNNDDLTELVTISKDTFVTAFEKDNDPKDFKNYIDHAFSESTMLSELKNSNSIFYFVFLGQELIAYFKLNEANAQNETFIESSIELERIYVISAHQSKGYGHQIINYIIQLVKTKRVTFLWLGVWQKNKSAILFYERLGFIKFGTHPYYIGNDKQTDWLMKLDLA